MTPKEKAQELFNKMFSPPNCVISLHRQVGRTFLAKQCALIAVDEILQVLQKGHPTDLVLIPMDMIDYWLEVKREIENP
jgi:hypothetical protein